jgi:outer membrane protein OmpA-like peptidoglycan-associated protein
MDDNLNFFGINPGQNDNFRTIYGVFSAIDLQQYPQLFTPKTTPIPPVSDVELKSYLRDAQDVVANADGGSSAPIAAASTVDYSKGTGGTVSHRSYNITFGTGSAVPTPEGEQVLSQLMDGVVITTLKIKLDGYTDSSGSSAVNTPLSATRAQAVKNWLQRKSPSNFPNNRFLSVQGHGPDNPVADNSTPQGKAANRRVDLTLVD